MAGLSGVGVIGEITAEDGAMRSGADLRAFADEHDLVRHRRASERLVEQVAESAMRTVFGEFRASACRNLLDGTEHLALVMGDVVAAGHSERGALVRVHSECLTGDILGSLRCDCGAQLEQALAEIAAGGAAQWSTCGARGPGDRPRPQAPRLRLAEGGLDTVDANTVQGLPVVSRSYGVGAQILGELGIRRLRLITNNPAKYGGLDGYGLDIVGRVALPVVETWHIVRYLRTKRERMNHELVLATDALPARTPDGSARGAAPPAVTWHRSPHTLVEGSL